LQRSKNKNIKKIRCSVTETALLLGFDSMPVQEEFPIQQGLNFMCHSGLFFKMNSTIKKYLRVFVCCLFLVPALFVFTSASAFAQIKILYVQPEQTDPAIVTVHSPHVAMYDPEASSQHRLFLFINGTGSKAANTPALVSIFAKWGYHAISIDYENNVLTASLGHSTNPAAFDQYREAIVTGAPGSDKVKVDPTNSILNRFQKLLLYLVAHDPNGGWDEFVKDGKPAWNRIIVAGHSQGSGHAAFIGKMFNVDRVMIFSGPQDYLDDLKKPAPWQGGPSATPPSRFFAFLSTNDPFNINHQEANCRLLMSGAQPETLNVKPGEAIHGHYQILINDAPKKSAHGSTISSQYTNVWKYMATENGK
jgi:hypothetical protein